MIGQRILEHFVKTLSHAEFGSICVTTPKQKRYEISGDKEGAHATMHIHDARAITAFAAKGDIGLADAYREGWWDSDDLEALILFGLQNEQALSGYLYGSLLGRLATRFMCFFSVHENPYVDDPLDLI